MNYRHAFHAGNFADLLKHAVLLDVLAQLTADPAPLDVLDTHAGRGLYDLSGEEAQRSQEAQAGITRLMAGAAPPAPLDALAKAVRALNGVGPLRRYPGSPLLTVQALRRGDRYVGCDLRSEEAAALEGVLAARTPAGVTALAREADGFAAAGAPARGRRFTLIDPPFERGDDYARIVQALAARPGGPALVWLPLKDLDTFDRFLSAVEDAGGAGALIVEARLRPLDQPLKMNGCALALLDGPDVSEGARRAAGWIVSSLGEAGGEARVWTL